MKPRDVNGNRNGLRRHAAVAIGVLAVSLAMPGCSGDQAESGGEIISEQEVQQLKNSARNSRDFRKAVEKKIRENLKSAESNPSAR